MRRTSLALILLVSAMFGCKSGKRMHLVDYSPPKESAACKGKDRPGRERNVWWDLLFCREKSQTDPVKLNLDTINWSGANPEPHESR